MRERDVEKSAAHFSREIQSIGKRKTPALKIEFSGLPLFYTLTEWDERRESQWLEQQIFHRHHATIHVKILCFIWRKGKFW